MYRKLTKAFLLKNNFKLEGEVYKRDDVHIEMLSPGSYYIEVGIYNKIYGVKSTHDLCLFLCACGHQNMVKSFI